MTASGRKQSRIPKKIVKALLIPILLLLASGSLRSLWGGPSQSSANIPVGPSTQEEEQRAPPRGRRLQGYRRASLRGDHRCHMLWSRSQRHADSASSALAG